MSAVLGTLPELNSLETHHLLSSMYETAFGIFDHVANQRVAKERARPFAAVAFHPGEDTISGSLLEDTMKAYRDFPIYEIFKLNYKEWMSQTVDIVEHQLMIAKQRRDEEMKIANAARIKAEQEAARQSPQIVMPSGRSSRRK